MYLYIYPRMQKANFESKQSLPGRILKGTANKQPHVCRCFVFQQLKRIPVFQDIDNIKVPFESAGEY